MQAIPSPVRPRPVPPSPTGAKPPPEGAVGVESKRPPASSSAKPGTGELEPHLEELCDMATD